MSSSFILSYADFMAHEFDDGEILAFGCCRGEVALVAGVTNKGKSTLIRVIALCAASGREFLPFVSASVEGLRVLLLDYEGSGGRTQADLDLMSQNLPSSEQELLKKNFFIAHAPRLNDQPLNLSTEMHMAQLLKQATEFLPDIILIDTAGAAFDLNSENDNAEINRVIMKPVIDKLVRSLNCVGVVVGHVGKSKGEQGVTREAAHKMRGGSVYGDRATSIFNIEGDPQNVDRIIVSCAKEKTGNNFEITLQLDRDTRWLKLVSEAPSAKRPTSQDKVLAVLTASTDSLETKAIVTALAGQASERTVKGALDKLKGNGLANNPKHGYWQASKLAVIVEVDSQSAKVQDAIAHKALHDCTNNGNS